MCALLGLLLFIGAAISLWQGATTGHLDTGLLLLFAVIAVLVGAGLGARYRQATAKHAEEDYWRKQG